MYFVHRFTESARTHTLTGMEAPATWDTNVLSYKDALREEVTALSELTSRMILVQQAAELQYYAQVAAEDADLAESIDAFEKAVDAGAVTDGSTTEEIRSAVLDAFKNAHP